jgi:hypothetical protein
MLVEHFPHDLLLHGFSAGAPQVRKWARSVLVLASRKLCAIRGRSSPSGRVPSAVASVRGLRLGVDGMGDRPAAVFVRPWSVGAPRRQDTRRITSSVAG